VEKEDQNCGPLFVIFKKSTQVHNESPNGRKFVKTGSIHFIESCQNTILTEWGLLLLPFHVEAKSSRVAQMYLLPFPKNAFYILEVKNDYSARGLAGLPEGICSYQSNNSGIFWSALERKM
jgi:hypothetical protein